MARWVRRRDRAGRVLAVANQKPGALDRYGLTREEADRAAWTIDRRGRRAGGAAAVNRVLRELGGVWGVIAAAYRIRPLAATEEAFYKWFARNRSRFHRFGVTPECDEPGAGCA
jgi:predicted DCC family thiol-disulfide oxidoreductase YuxK